MTKIMTKQIQINQVTESHPTLNRRHFLASTGAAALSLSLIKPEWVSGTEANSKMNLGLIGCGGRGSWIANLFKNHGGYNIIAVADYFPDRVNAFADKFQIADTSRYTGLSGYRRMLEQKLDAVAIESPPYFHPEQAAAAVEAGCHVYLAKPIAVDVPGCRSVAESGKKATANRRCFLVDFQTRASKSYQEAVQRVRNGDIGRVIYGEACYRCGNTFDGLNKILKANPASPEARLRAWGLDRVLSGDVITEQNIHALDVAAWFLDADPLRAYGTGGAARGFAGSCWDHWAVIFHYPEGRFVSFNSKQMGTGLDDILCRFFGTAGVVETNYFGKVFITSDDPYNGGVMKNLYQDGAVQNIADFHNCITQGKFENRTVAPSVRSNLTTILGRLAAYRGKEVTWDEMIRENEKLEFNPNGLKA
jgi:predicted dehydrogenase